MKQRQQSIGRQEETVISNADALSVIDGGVTPWEELAKLSCLSRVWKSWSVSVANSSLRVLDGSWDNV